MHKSLIVKSGYCNFNWWNSCLCLDVMFRYMDLKIIKLLMLNFICLWCIYMYTCVLPKIDEEWIVVDGLLVNSCLIDVVVIMRCCCWWFIPWVFIITDFWYELSCCWGFCKNGLNWWIVLKWYLISCLMCFWKPFWVHEPVNNLCKHIWVLGDQNWAFWVKKGKNPKVSVQNYWLYA